MTDILKLKALLEAIAHGEAPQTTLDDLKRIWGYDPKTLAEQGLSVLANIAEQA